MLAPASTVAVKTALERSRGKNSMFANEGKHSLSPKSGSLAGLAYPRPHSQPSAPLSQPGVLPARW